jgi:hypothetical protein
MDHPAAIPEVKVHFSLPQFDQNLSLQFHQFRPDGPGNEEDG